MKAFKLIGAAAAATLLLLSSCLGESDNTFSNTSFAVGGISEKKLFDGIEYNIILWLYVFI